MPFDQLRREAADPERLIEGEDPAATDSPTAEHWLVVYRQLLSTKSGLLADLRRGMTTMDPVARDEMVRTDEFLLQSQVDRLSAGSPFGSHGCAGMVEA